MSMVKCPFCNEQTDNSNKFCMYCGTLLPTDTPKEDNATQPKPTNNVSNADTPLTPNPIKLHTQTSYPYPPPTAPHKQGGFIFLLVLTIFLVILAVTSPFAADENDNIGLGLVFYSALAAFCGFLSYKIYSQQKQVVELYKKIRMNITNSQNVNKNVHSNNK